MVGNPLAGTANSSFGFYNPNHTSNVALHYQQGHLITPWPIIPLSLGVFVVLGYLGYRGATKGSRESPSQAGHQNDTPWLTIGGLIYSSLRLIFLLVVVPQESATGLPFPTALLLFLFSIIPYSWNPLLRTGLQIAAFVEALIIAGIMCALDFRTSKKLSDGSYQFYGFQYGNLVVTGGNCPSTISKNRSTCEEMQKIITFSGCTNWTGSSLPIITAPIGITEFVFELFSVIFVFFGIILYAVLFFHSLFDSRTFLQLLKGKGQRDPDGWD